ncbi:uncharacterized RNA pseudouridine synthase ZMO0505-like isoform X2 [Dysidea avara]|uniref:uncharacterized RNA pseudouridine synthase ZMO0505-like isoform X2 n=1 Tax=Dysidea avara TaxID=196820 RepID=UPI00331C1445
MFGAGRLAFHFQPRVVSLRYLRTANQTKRKAKLGRGGKVKQKSQKTGRRRQTKLELDHVIEQSQDVLNIAKPQTVYYPPPHITPELADELVLYKDGGPEVIHDLSNYMVNWSYGLKESPHLAHRIDKITSGALLLTRHTDSARRFADLFSERIIQKTYLALCVGIPLKAQGRIRLPIAMANIGQKRRTYRAVLVRDADIVYSEKTLGRTIDTLQIAQTDYKVLGQAGVRCCLLQLHPMTGFQHQLRVHLADGLNTPIIGDKKFAGPVLRRQSNTHLRRRMKLIDGAMCKQVTYLHAYQLTIPKYKDNRALTITAPLPNYFIHSLQRLKISLPKGHSLEMKTWKVT